MSRPLPEPHVILKAAFIGNPTWFEELERWFSPARADRKRAESMGRLVAKSYKGQLPPTIPVFFVGPKDVTYRVIDNEGHIEVWDDAVKGAP